jgi:hypothetical protein
MVLGRRHTTDTGDDDDVLMNVQPGTVRIEYLHAALLQDTEWQRRQPSFELRGGELYQGVGSGYHNRSPNQQQVGQRCE